MSLEALQQGVQDIGRIIQLATGAATVGVAIVDASHTILWASLRGPWPWGIEPPVLLGQHLSSAWSEDWSQVAPCVNAAFAGNTGDATSCELDMLDRAGGQAIRRIRVSCDRREDRAGQRLVVLIAVDITAGAKLQAELEASEQRARHSEALFSAVMDSLPVSVIVADRDGRLVSMNPASQTIWGPAPLVENVDEYAAYVGYWPDTGQRVAAHEWPMARAVLRGETSVGVRVAIERFHDQGRRLLDISAAPVVGADGQRLGGVVACHDVTERAQAEEALRTERDRFGKLVETAPAAICSFQRRPDGTFFFPYASGKTSEIFGVDADQLTADSFPLFNIVHPEDVNQVRQTLEQSAEGLGNWNSNFRIRHTTRGEVWVEVRAAPARLGDGSTIWHGFIADVSERMQAEAALRESEWRFRKVFEHAATGIGITDDNGKFLQCNPAYCQILGLSEAELKQAELATLIHPDDRAQNMQLLEQLANGEISGYELENRFLHTSGAPVWVHKVVTSLGGPSTRASYLMALVTNINQRRQAEMVLRESEERLRLAIEAGDLGVWEYDPNTDVAIRSLRHDQMFGYREVQSNWGLDSVMKHLLPEDRPQFQQALAAGLATGEFAVEMRVRWSDGTIHWLDIRGRTEFDATGQPARMRGVIADVTDRVRAAELLKSVMASVTDAILTIDSYGRIESANPATERLFGWSDAELFDRSIQDLFITELTGSGHDLLRPLGNQLGIGLGREVTCRRWDHSTFPAELTVSEFRLEDACRYTVVVRDISARYRLEEQFRQAQKMEAIGRLAGGVAHDFNNLLTVINGYSDLLLAQMSRDEPTLPHISAIHDAGQRAAALTSQLLAFSRKAIIAPLVFDIRDVLGQSQRLLQRLLGEDILIDVAMPQHACFIKADPNQIDQIVMNLAVNARDAMPQGGRLRLSVQQVIVSEEEVATNADLQPGPYIDFSVTDNGIGMPSEIQTRIFEPFFTTKSEGHGTGLGLATVFGIVKQAGAHIAVVSQLGHGTTFRILFPATHEPLTNCDSVAPATSDTLGSETILLAEDDPAVRRLVKSALESQGYKVFAASDGMEALDLLRNSAVHFDLLVTDVVMPGMSGRQLADRVISLAPQIKVLFVTGYTDDSALRHGVQDEQDAFLQKPFTPLGLVRKIRSMLDAEGQAWCD